MVLSRLSLLMPRNNKFIVAGIGPFATIGYEPRQVRKEATVVADSGAEVWLVLATISLYDNLTCFVSTHLEFNRRW